MPHEVVLRKALVQDDLETCEVLFTVIAGTLEFREMLLPDKKKARQPAE